MTETLDIRPCRSGEHGAALHLIYEEVPAGERSEAIEAVMADATRGEVDFSHLLGAWCGGGLVGAVMAMECPGRSAMIWPPHVSHTWQAEPVAIHTLPPPPHFTRPAASGDVPGSGGLSRSALPESREEVEDALVAAALRRLGRVDIRFVQALVEPSGRAKGEALLRNGFTRATELVFLRRPLDRAAALEPLDPRVTYRSYSDDLRATLASVIEATYEDTLDCPQLNGVRTIDDVLASHRGEGPLDPANWMLAYQGERPVGCVLIAPQPPSPSWELTYMGVVPSARGQKLGLQLTLKALAEAGNRGASALTLAVDVHNAPARETYRRLGFQPWDHRELLLHTLASGTQDGHPHEPRSVTRGEGVGFSRGNRA